MIKWHVEQTAVLFNVFGKDNCPYCVKAKKLLAGAGLSFNYVRVGEDMSVEEFKKLFPSAKTVPQITVLVDGEVNHIGGYDMLEAYLSW